MSYDDEDDDFDELPDDGDDNDDADTVACPECGADVYDDAPQCPRCGAYLTTSTSLWQGKPIWWIVLGLVGMVAVILSLVSATGIGF